MNYHLIEEDREEANAILADLHREKQRLRKKLWAYEIEFYDRHGRVADTRDKESVRHLYSSYKDVTNKLRAREGRDGMTRSCVDCKAFEVDDARDEDRNVDSSTSKRVFQLKAERKALNHIIKSYEVEFQKRHKRRVSSLRDTQPIASKYRRYVVVKRELEELIGNK
mmetsp:Transcript_19519/g.40891  ORF Transcript_19519/g.40891 Transcript_19519/m.40891 type:complete len:167 (-) Transcript_19519:444-944(-)